MLRSRTGQCFVIVHWIFGFCVDFEPSFVCLWAFFLYSSRFQWNFFFASVVISVCSRRKVSRFQCQSAHKSLTFHCFRFSTQFRFSHAARMHLADTIVSCFLLFFGSFLVDFSSTWNANEVRFLVKPKHSITELLLPYLFYTSSHRISFHFVSFNEWQRTIFHHFFFLLSRIRFLCFTPFRCIHGRIGNKHKALL